MIEDPCEKCGAGDWLVQTKRGVEYTTCLNCGDRYEAHTFKPGDPNFEKMVAKLPGIEPVKPKAKGEYMQKWEYRTMVLDEDRADVRALCRQLGLEGWELCAINSPMYWFKRPAGEG